MGYHPYCSALLAIPGLALLWRQRRRKFSRFQRYLEDVPLIRLGQGDPGARRYDHFLYQHRGLRGFPWSLNEILHLGLQGLWQLARSAPWSARLLNLQDNRLHRGRLLWSGNLHHKCRLGETERIPCLVTASLHELPYHCHHLYKCELRYMRSMSGHNHRLREWLI